MHTPTHTYTHTIRCLAKVFPLRQIAMMAMKGEV